MMLASGTRLGNFEITGLLGKGGACQPGWSTLRVRRNRLPWR
jgi:hypothetical protein